MWNRNSGSRRRSPTGRRRRSSCSATRPGRPVSHVPLSCVPPCSMFALCGLTDRLWNWSVRSPLFSPSSFDGTRESICLQRASVGREPAVVAPRRDVAEVAVRAHDAAVVRLEELERVARGRDETCWSGWSAFGWSWVGRVHRHVRPADARVGREDHGALVRDRLAVRVGAARVDDVRMALRRVDEDVVPALRRSQRLNVAKPGLAAGSGSTGR